MAPPRYFATAGPSWSSAGLELPVQVVKRAQRVGIKVVIAAGDVPLRLVVKRELPVRHQPADLRNLPPGSDVQGQTTLAAEHVHFGISSGAPLKFTGTDYSLDVAFKVASCSSVALDLSTTNAQLEKRR